MGDTTSSSDRKVRQQRREWPLAAILTARFTLVAAIPVLAFAYALIFHVIPSVRQDVDAHQRAIASAVVSQVESYFSVADRELQTLAILLGDNSRDPAQTTALLDAYVNANEFYEAIYLSDETGRVCAIGLPHAMRGLRANHIGLDIAHRDFVREARQRQTSVWSNSFLSPVSLRLTLAIALPVGARMLVGEVAVTPLPTLAKRITSDLAVTVMMLDRQNQLTAHSADAHANQQLNLGHLPLVAAARTGSKGVQTDFEFDGQAVVGSAWPIARLDWLVLVTQPRELAYSQIAATWNRLFGTVLAAIVAALAAAIWTSGAVTRRFQIYNRQSRAIADGRYDVHWETSDTKEFNQLRDNLERMANAIRNREEQMTRAQAELQLSEQQLRALNATLEDRVDERTDELTRANDELVQTLETLQHAQKELLRSEKLSALGAMVAGIAHELNTPIGNGLMAGSTLAEHNRVFQGEVDAGNLRRSSLERYLADSRTATDILLRNLDRAGELIRSFKQVAVDQTSAQRRTFRLDEVIDEILLALQPTLKKRPLTLNREIDAEIWLDSYPGPLGQIITNLINNSITHGFAEREHGTIRIIGKQLANDQVQLAICDDGTGIAPEHLTRVFDPFFTTRLGQGGSGLGMNIVHTLATQVLGGQIRIDSTVGTGTCVTLDLPQRAPESPAEENVGF
jgi:signal transduction histidine kinase